MSSTKSIAITMPEFDDLADSFWRLGVMQSPSKLQGYLIGLLVVDDDISPEQWLAMASQYIEAVQPPKTEDSDRLLALHTAANAQLSDGELDLQLLLPGDAVEISQRIEAISQWCQGLLTGFVIAGKAVQERQGQQQYSQDVSEALSDIAAISEIGLSEDEGDHEQREHNIFEISEYLRLAAITLYLECHKECHKPADVVGSAAATARAEAALDSPESLFKQSTKTLH